jgi:hypothetical protein
MKLLTVRELLAPSQEFDPLNLDTSEIRELSNLLPADGQVDINQAEILATRFLRGADLCGELMAIATCYVAKLETAKKKAYSEAALSKASAAGIKTDRSRLLYADGDSDYIEACNKYSEGQAFLKWVSSKQDSLIRAHYNCKKLLDRNYQHEQASGFNCSTDKVIQEEQNNWGQTEQHASARREEPEGVSLINDDSPGEEQQLEDDFGKDW